MKHVYERPVPRGTKNAITWESIRNQNEMVNFQGEKNGYGRHYKESTWNSFAKNEFGYKQNPFTRKIIGAKNVYRYTANVSGGKRKITRRKRRFTRRRG